MVYSMESEIIEMFLWGLGLDNLIILFKEYDIDVDLLKDLFDEELRDLLMNEMKVIIGNCYRIIKGI